MDVLSMIGEALSELEAAVVAFGTSPQMLVVVILLCWLDGFFPPFPSESIVIAVTAGLVGSGGSVADIALLAAAAAFGAFCGDMTAYVLGSRFGVERWRVFRTARGRSALTAARTSLARHGSSYIFAGRFVPIGRVFINMAAGATGYSRVRFRWLALAGSVFWGVWATMLGVAAGYVLGDQPLVAAAVGAVVGVLMGLLVDRLLHVLQAMKRTYPPGLSRTLGR